MREEISPELKTTIGNAPRATGVYLMKDVHGKVLYVGKAKNLRARVRSYFGGKDSRPAVPFLVRRIHDVEFIVTNTEKEALILENNLIKEHRPRYNVYFRDDKEYIRLRIDRREPFPRLQLVRRPKKDGAVYLGPYASSASVKETLHLIQPIFPLRTCGDLEFKNRKRPCVEYEIKRCLAPCVGRIGHEDYHRLVNDVITFLKGGEREVVADLRRRMAGEAASYRFEEAARLRDTIAAIETTLEKQKAVSMSRQDEDIFGMYREAGLVRVCTICVRGGSIVGRKSFPSVRSGMDPADIFSSLLKQHYDEDVFIPAEILIPVKIEDRAVMEEWLTEKREGRVRILTPEKGEKRALIEMACNNARHLFEREKTSDDRHEGVKETLQRVLHLKNRPDRIECFDISTVGGEHAVGSMVAFSGDVPDKSGYRRFRIRTVRGMDDYGMMYEVLKRRYSDQENLPDLIMVDGGKGQLHVALTVLKELGIDGIDALGFAKENRDSGKRRGGIQKEEDRAYIPGRKDPLYLSRYPGALHFLQRVRDEAHRFAVTYHRQVKEKRDFQSLLDEIRGIGESRKRALLTAFDDVERIKEASVEDLQKVKGITPPLARRIREFLNNGLSPLRGESQGEDDSP
jgi:excinuclease ABC subunit C